MSCHGIVLWGKCNEYQKSILHPKGNQNNADAKREPCVGKYLSNFLPLASKFLLSLSSFVVVNMEQFLTKYTNISKYQGV